VEAVNPDDAHRPLDKTHNLAASLSHVETRQVRKDYALRFEGWLYQIQRQHIVAGLRRAEVHVEKRLDGSLAVRFGERYLTVAVRTAAKKAEASPLKKKARPPRRARRGSDWNQNFDLKKSPKIWQASRGSGRR
jgi:hypothetical protein